eukprot:5666379-Pyramimonas_sp.AAC.1
MRAEVFRVLGEFQNALDDAVKATVVNPTDSQAQYQVGLTHFALGDLKASEEALLKSLELRPREIVQVRLAEVQEQLRIDAGRPNLSSSSVTTSQALLADESMAKHQLHEASGFYTAAIATRADKKLYSKRSECFLEMCLYQQVSPLLPDPSMRPFLSCPHAESASPHNSLCNVPHGAQALKDASKCIELDPHWAQGHFDKGCAEAALFKFASARQSFQTVSCIPARC